MERLGNPISLVIAMLVLIPGLSGEVTASAPTSAELNRRVEVLIRSKFSVPPQYNLIIGDRTPSAVAGYDNVKVTLNHDGKETIIDFLLSKDCKTVARLEKFDISEDPAHAIDVAERPIRGDASAKAEIINFDDLECPFCARLNSELLQETQGHYKGLIKVVYKDYPLDGHPWARHAAVDANCLADLSTQAYWSYVDYVHGHGENISGAERGPAESYRELDRIAGTIAKQGGVDEAKLSMCLKRQDETIVNLSLKLGASLGIQATPQMFVNGERLPAGARPVEELWPAINRALKAQGIQPPAQP